MYRAALVEAAKGKKREDGPEVLEELKASQLVDGKRDADPSAGRKWTLLMFGGGHFAGMIVSLVPRLVSRGKGKEKEREVVIIEKKTFHRYTSASLCFDRSLRVRNAYGGSYSTKEARRVSGVARCWKRQG